VLRARQSKAPTVNLALAWHASRERIRPYIYDQDKDSYWLGRLREGWLRRLTGGAELESLVGII
jgi:hypothetical protein